MKIGRGMQMVVVRALVLGAIVAGLPSAAGAASSLEPLLKAADIQKVGLQGVILSPPDAFDRIEQMGFELSTDGTMVVVLSRLDDVASSGTLGQTLGIIAKDVAPVPGVGDEAYSYLGGMAFAFRKGKAAFQLMSGIDMANNGRAFLTRDQFAALAKLVCSRL